MEAHVADDFLVLASALGDLEKVRELLGRSANVHYQNEFGQTALMAAVLSNRLEAAEMLLLAGSDPDAKDRNGLSPFIAAGAHGYAHLLKGMAEYGADVTSVNRFGGTALLPSSEKGYAKTVQYGVKAGVPVCHANRLGWTALHEAVILGDGGFLYGLVIRLLLEGGADIHIKDRQGLSPLEHARLLGQQRIVGLLENMGTENAYLENELLALYKEGRYEEALKIIEKAFAEGAGDEMPLHFWTGLMLQEEKRYERAIAAYRKGMQASGAGSEFHFCLANCFRLMDRPEEALEALEQGSEENPQSTFFLYHKSNYFRELGRHSEAVAAMDELLSRLPDRPDFLFHKANSLRSLGKHEEAVRAMEEAIAIDPGNGLFSEHKSRSIELLGKDHYVQSNIG
ncbi:tetratricopeptide repeat protein [Planococcus chinensis]|uniref:Tetratricopeptide repeat protein n=1 Tax=Planococcus chinensis TaxID=272917 RepID=A0ABW4QCY3_9BACL